nr:RNA-dependent RNA polymerase [Plum bark necrosis stem pitting-associated virus]
MLYIRLRLLMLYLRISTVSLRRRITCCLLFSLSSVPNEYEIYGEILIPSPDRLLRPCRSHLVSIGFLLDDLNLSGMTLNLEFCEDIFQTSDFSSSVDNVVLSEKDIAFKTYRAMKYQPLNKSIKFSRRLDNTRSNLYVFEQRNLLGNVEINRSLRPSLVHEIVDDFFRVFIDTSKFSEVVGDYIGQNVVALENWLRTRTPLGKSALVRDLEASPDWMGDLNRFKIMVKADMKSKLDGTAETSLPSGQNIVYHRRNVCLLFSSVFQQLTERLKFLLKPNVKLFHGCSLDDFAQSLRDSAIGELTSYYCAEVDLSKYDKSQNDFTKGIEHEIYRRLGLDPELLDFWSASDFSSQVGSTSRGFSLSIGSQRRTGTATTWLGNTVVNMALMARVLGCEKFSSMAFSGDDSILFHHSPLDLDISNYELHFAFDVKLFRMTVPYFCSKFFVVGSSGLQFVPDPVKLFVSLGSEKNDEESVMRERFISFLDLTKAYEDLTVCDNLTTLVSIKWGYSDFLSCSLFAIHSLRANFGQFMRLWRLCQQNVVFEKFNKIKSDLVVDESDTFGN